MNTPTSSSPNFGFLAAYGDPVLHCATLAERYVWEDPQTTLFKVRSLGEMLAKQTSARSGLDPTGMDFADIVSMLVRNRLISLEVRDLFDIVRLRGNEAVHNETAERQAALAALITAHRLAIWFHRVASDSSDFNPGPFRPPPNPRNVEATLREELESLRRDADDFFGLAHQEIAALEQAKEQLAEEAKSSRGYAELLSLALDSTKETAERDRATFEAELKRLSAIANAQSPAALKSFVDRSKSAASSLGQWGKRSEHVPLAQIRIQGPRVSYCCRAPTLLVQSMQGGFVTANCSKCNGSSSVKKDEFLALNVWVTCPECHVRMKAAIVGRGNYGYQCPKCAWACLLASIVPHYAEC